MTTDLILAPAEVFPPGDFLRDELTERGWAEAEFADIIGRPVQVVSEILNGRKEITPDTALSIGAALGTSAELWVNLQTTYDLHKVRSNETRTESVQRRARLRELVPVRELQKRSWLLSTTDLDELEASVCELLGIDRIGDEPRFAIAARRSNESAKLTPEQTAWIARIERLGSKRSVASYSGDALAVLASQLVRRLEGPQDLAHLGDWLAECGVALVVELPLRNSKIDGVVSLTNGVPVIGLSTRGDRMDSFVFTLLHEVAHLLLGHVGTDGLRIDEDIEENSSSKPERLANETAAKWVFERLPDLPAGELRPRVLVETARACGVHVSFLIGRLQSEGRLSWSDYRRTIPKVRPYVRFG